MVRKAKTKLIVTEKKVGNRVYKYARVYLPRKLFTDSRFPFKADDALEVKIVGRHLVVKKSRQRRKTIV